MADSSWHVRLRAADLVTTACAGDAALVAALRGWLPTATVLNRTTNGAAWQPAAHALVALARVAPVDARAALPGFAGNASHWVRVYAARAAAVLSDTQALRTLARDGNDNVKEAAIDALAKLAGHAEDSVYVAGLNATGYQAVRASALALKGATPTRPMRHALVTAAQRMRGDSSETSRDARTEVMARIAEMADAQMAAHIATLASDFDCVVAAKAAAIATTLGTPTEPRCTPFARPLPADAVRLALGDDVRVRVVMAPASGGGSFVVRLRGDVAPIMAARILALVQAKYYDGRAWHRVEPDFVIQGPSPDDNEYAGHPRFLRDELGTVPHVRGTVGMSTRGHDTGDAQWFVNLKNNLELGRDYTVFGEIVEGIAVADGVLEGDVIQRIEVVRGR
jgi:peptidyl-prolyl cis-trans isomerase B (cyclophilin B)